MRQEHLARRYMVSGRVQGVGFRNYVEHVAEKLGIQGYVRNRRDGSVEVYAISDAQRLKQLRSALQKGPLMSNVTNVAEKTDCIDEKYLGNFTIELTI